jgi:hypothetical protein
VTPDPVRGSPRVEERHSDPTPAPCERCRPHVRHAAWLEEMRAMVRPRRGTQPVSRSARGVTAAVASRHRGRRRACILTEHAPGRRQEGNGRSDAVRLLARNKSSKGVNALTGTSPVRSVRSSGRGSRWWPKRSEPHARLRDATSPEPASWSKPSRWCETTRAERDASVWQPMPEGAAASVEAPGVDARRQVGERHTRGRSPGEADEA